MEKKLAIINKLLWDYNIDPQEIFELLIGKRERVYHFTREKAFIRVLEGLYWYEILVLLPIDTIKNLLTKDIIAKFRTRSIR